MGGLIEIYCLFIKSTFVEYLIDNVFYFESIEDAKANSIKILSNIKEATINQRQKDYCDLLNNNINHCKSQVSFGYGTNVEYLAVEIIEDSKIMQNRQKLEAIVRKKTEAFNALNIEYIKRTCH